MNSISDDDVDRALDFLQDNAKEAAQARAERAYIEQYRKTLKAEIMKEHLNMPIGGQEREAYADPRYKALLDGLRDAVKADEYHRFMRVAAEAKIEAWRTQSSNARSKI
jgi:hypothetical protein